MPIVLNVIIAHATGVTALAGQVAGLESFVCRDNHTVANTNDPALGGRHETGWYVLGGVLEGLSEYEWDIPEAAVTNLGNNVWRIRGYYQRRYGIHYNYPNWRHPRFPALRAGSTGTDDGGSPPAL